MNASISTRRKRDERREKNVGYRKRTTLAFNVSPGIIKKKKRIQVPEGEDEREGEGGGEVDAEESR